MTGKHLKTNCLKVSVCAGICYGVKHRCGDCMHVVCIMKMQILTLEVWGLQRSSGPRTWSAGCCGGVGGGVAAERGLFPTEFDCRGARGVSPSP